MIDKMSAPAIRGIQRSIDGLRRTADDIATQAATGRRGGQGDLARSLVQLKQHETQAASNAKVLKAADDMLGTLLDVKA